MVGHSSISGKGEFIEQHLALQTIVGQAFAQLQAKNPSYSLRSFAAKLGMSPSATSEILRGKRKVSVGLAEKILVRLGVDPKERQKTLRLYENKSLNAELSEVNRYWELRSDEFQLISKWYHFAVLSLAELKEFQFDPLWIAHRLGISYRQAESTMERLERLGYLKRKIKCPKQVEILKPELTSSDGVADDAVRISHLEDLKLAERALDQIDLNLRDFTSLTIAIDKSKLAYAKKMIRDFQDQIVDFLSVGKLDEVYKISIQMYPLTKQNLPNKKWESAEDVKEGEV